jgi:putative tryptophan/tyrosine transport system substrate-binding protein
MLDMKRRELIALLGSAAVAWPLAVRAQQAMPVIAFLNGGAPDASARNGFAFRKGLSEMGYVEGRNVTVEYHWLEGQYHRVTALVADLVRRGVTVIASPGFPPGALAAKAATTAVPIVFGVGDDPVKLGLVASLARPGGNVTGINFFVHEIVSKRLALLHELVPTAARIAVLVNPGNTAAAEATLKEAREAAPALGLQMVAFKAGTMGEIDAAFAAIARERGEALLVGGDGFFFTRREQFAALAARDRLPTISAVREFAEAGGLMSYGTALTDMFRQAGIYAGSIVKGAKPADLPVLQSTRFELVINLRTARALGIEVPPMLLARADEVIE